MAETKRAKQRDLWAVFDAHVRHAFVDKDVAATMKTMSFDPYVHNFMLPGIPPTGKKVAVPHVVVMTFEGDKVAHEHIYWDQASVLAQVGLLDEKKMPISGVEQARQIIRLSKTKKPR